MVIDYGLLNKNTWLNRFPLPWMENLLEKLALARIFSKTDLNNAYHQVSIHPTDEHKTTFFRPKRSV